MTSGLNTRGLFLKEEFDYLAQLQKQAIKELTFTGTGNHDMWSFGYLEDELGITFHHEPQILSWDGIALPCRSR